METLPFTNLQEHIRSTKSTKHVSVSCSESEANRFTIHIRVLVDSHSRFHTKTQLSLTVSPSDVIKEIKEKLADELKTYSEDQTIRFGPKVLEDALPLSYYSIQPKSTIDVIPRGFQLRIHYFHSTPFDITVQPYFTIRNVKQCIADIKCIPIQRQRLLFEGSEMCIDSHTLYHYNIKWGARIQLLLRDDPFQITIQFRNGMKSPLTVTAEDTVKKVKSMIAKKVGVRLDRQRLVFNGKKLKNSHVLQYYNIPRHALLQLTVSQPTARGVCQAPFDIFIHCSNTEDISLRVTPFSSIQGIKERLADSVKTYPENQILKYDNKTLENQDTLLDCGIKSGYVLNLISSSYTINVLLSQQESFLVVVRSSNTLRYVKCALITCKGIRLDRHKIRFQGKELEDDATLYDCGIKAQSRLELVVKWDPITIHLRTEGGDACTMRAAPHVRIQAVKKKMGLDPEKYLWLFESRLLPDDQSTLYDCGITDNAVIDIIPYELLYQTMESQHTHESESLLLEVKDEWEVNLEDDGVIAKQDKCHDTDSDSDSVSCTDRLMVQKMTPNENKLSECDGAQEGDTPGGLSAYAMWLLRLTRHLNAFDEIYNEHELNLSATHKLYDHIATASSSFNAITEQVPTKK